MPGLVYGLYDEVKKHPVGEVRTGIKENLELMTGHDLKFLKKGRYAAIYLNKESGTVVKVGDANNNAGYMAYLKLARRNQHNPFFPKVHWVGCYMSDDHPESERFFVAHLERLQEGPAFIRKGIFLPSWGRVAQFMHICRIAQSYELPSFMGQQTPKDLKDFFWVLKKEFGGNGGAYKWDLHEANIMMRKSGQLVVTDPWA